MLPNTHKETAAARSSQAKTARGERLFETQLLYVLVINLPPSRRPIRVFSCQEWTGPKLLPFHFYSFCSASSPTSMKDNYFALYVIRIRDKI